jgi:hypothetical protein
LIASLGAAAFEFAKYAIILTELIPIGRSDFSPGQPGERTPHGLLRDNLDAFLTLIVAQYWISRLRRRKPPHTGERG